MGGRLYPAPTWIPERKDFIIRVGGANTSIWASTGVDSGQPPASTWEDGRLGGRICHDLLQGTLEAERRNGDGRLVDLDLKFLWKAELGLLVIVGGGSRDLD